MIEKMKKAVRYFNLPMVLYPVALLLNIQCSVHTAVAQPPKNRISREEYIEKYREDAIKDMIRTKVPASITLGQAMLESDCGNSKLAKNANNHFGIKCHNGWTGGTYMMDDDAKNECFRKYKSVLDSYNDHSDFLKTRSRYAFLFDLKPTDYKGWAEGLKKAGYATSPTYPRDLIKIIEDNKLYELDKLNKVPEKEVKVVRKDAPAKPNLTNTPPLNTSTRQILLNNDVKYVVALKGDSYFKIAKALDMNTGQLIDYNEVDKNSNPKEGQIVYLQPKRRSAEVEFHTVKAGETMYSISQLYGIKLKFLYSKNLMEAGTEPVIGQKLWLKNTKKESPQKAK